MNKNFKNDTSASDGNIGSVDSQLIFNSAKDAQKDVEGLSIQQRIDFLFAK